MSLDDTSRLTVGHTPPDPSQKEIDFGVSAEHEPWVHRARVAYGESTDFLQTNLRGTWERNLRNFGNRHPLRSKYHGDAYKERSVLFRPRTRAAVKKGEAACANAFFATPDVVSVEPVDDGDEMQRAAAQLNGSLLNYRLGAFGNQAGAVKWYLTLLGAFQDTQTLGLCCSKQWWRYETRDYLEPEFDDQGLPILDAEGRQMMVRQSEVLHDHPSITLIPPENIRYHPAADWLDPVGTSPYLIYMIPMFAGDVLARMQAPDDKTGQGDWKSYNLKQILHARTDVYSSIRRAREDNRTDSRDQGTSIGEFEIVWVHENFIKHEGQDYHYYTLRTHALLTEPRPIEEVYWTGERPFAIGHTNIESHKNFPASNVELLAPLQAESNDIANQRRDNVKLAMNGRHKVVRGRNVDIEALKRSVPGGMYYVTHVDDVTTDRPQDVTGSSYQEEDRLNADFDDMAGTFSNVSVMTNRKLSETVGGMQMARSAASAVGDYQIRIFSETWVEQVMRQVLHLEQTYESDTTVLALAAKNAGLFQRYGQDLPLDELLQRKATVRVNVGVGATDPDFKLGKFERVTAGLAGLAGDRKLDLMAFDELAQEAYGLAGYKDARRFLNDDGQDEDPQLAAAKKRIQELEEELEADLPQLQSRERVAQLQAQADLEKQALANQGDIQVAEIKTRADLAIAAEDNEGDIDVALIKARADLEKVARQGMVAIQRERMVGQRPKPSVQAAGS